MVKIKSGKFNIWRAKSNGDPIDGTDYIMNAPSKRWALKHIAYENNVELPHNSMIVRLPNGEFWCASEFQKFQKQFKLKNENKDENKRSIRFY